MQSYAAALRDYDKAIQLNPDLLSAYMHRGEANRQLGKFSDAIDDFNLALRFAPDRVETLSNRGWSRLMLADDMVFSSLWGLPPIDENGRLSFAAMFILFGPKGLKLYRDAEKDFDRALFLDASYGAAFDGRATARCRLGNTQGSYEDRVQSIRIGSVSIKNLQWEMSLVIGYYEGPIDGVFDSETDLALAEWTTAGCELAPGKIEN